MNQFDLIKELTQKCNAIKQDIQAKISALPDNPKINRLSANSFNMRFSDTQFGNHNLSPHFYDFRYQYQQIIKKIESINVVNLEKTLNSMITHGCINPKMSSNNGKILLHPDVVQHLKSIVA